MGWLREPLPHFLLLGGLLFVAYGWLAPAEPDRQQIVVNAVVAEELVRQYKATWMRPPTVRELDGLVESYVRDEILYREGMAMGLDRDDAVIKRRVRQKLEVLTEEQQARNSPSDAELADYLVRNAARFTRPGVVSFEQIMLETPVAQEQVALVVTLTRTALANGAPGETLGQRTLLPYRLEQVPLDRVARDFGKGFTEQLDRLPVGEWSGPVVSGIGSHLVRLIARLPPTVPPLDAVRVQVAREWEYERRERSRTESYRRMRERYAVVVEPLPGADAAAQR